MKYQFPFRTKCQDLTLLLNEKDYEEFKKEINEIEIGILFNNAGIAEKKLMNFCKNTHKEITRYLDCILPYGPYGISN